MKSILKHYYFLLLILALGCNQDDEVTPVNDPKAGDLVDYQKVISYSEDDIENLIELAGFEQYSNLFTKPVDLYEVSYRTTFKGELITCSGLISFPQNSNNTFPTLVFNHGTVFAHSNAPSEKSISFEFLFSGAGYMTVIPDYIGFGASEQFLHPYYVREPMAGAVVDMIKASKEFSKELNLSIDDKLFLSGYSEGGYVTLATQRAIELDTESDLQVTASAAGAGGYNLKGVMEKITDKDTFASPNYLAYIIRAYNETLDWNVPLSTFFNDPYIDLIPDIVDGSKTGGFINGQLDDSLKILFDNTFLENLKSGTEDLLLPALEDNSLTDWTPLSPTRMYHGTDDEIVPFEDSKETYQHFINKGAGNLKFFEIEGGTHSSSFGPMIINVLPWFEKLRDE